MHLSYTYRSIPFNCIARSICVNMDYLKIAVTFGRYNFDCTWTLLPSKWADPNNGILSIRNDKDQSQSVNIWTDYQYILLIWIGKAEPRWCFQMTHIIFSFTYHSQHYFNSQITFDACFSKIRRTTTFYAFNGWTIHSIETKQSDALHAISISRFTQFVLRKKPNYKRAVLDKKSPAESAIDARERARKLASISAPAGVVYDNI